MPPMCITFRDEFILSSLNKYLVDGALFVPAYRRNGHSGFSTALRRQKFSLRGHLWPSEPNYQGPANQRNLIVFERGSENALAQRIGGPISCWTAAVLRVYEVSSGATTRRSRRRGARAAADRRTGLRTSALSFAAPLEPAVASSRPDSALAATKACARLS